MKSTGSQQDVLEIVLLEFATFVEPYEPYSLFLKKSTLWHALSNRVDISDTLMYVYEMLGAELLSNLYDRLGRLLMDTERPTSWQVSSTSYLYTYQHISH